MVMCFVLFDFGIGSSRMCAACTQLLNWMKWCAVNHRMLTWCSSTCLDLPKTEMVMRTTWSFWRLWWRVSTGSCWCVEVAERSSPYIHKVTSCPTPYWQEFCLYGRLGKPYTWFYTDIEPGCEFVRGRWRFWVWWSARENGDDAHAWWEDHRLITHYAAYRHVNLCSLTHFLFVFCCLFVQSVIL